MNGNKSHYYNIQEEGEPLLQGDGHEKHPLVREAESEPLPTSSATLISEKINFCLPRPVLRKQFRTSQVKYVFKRILGFFILFVALFSSSSAGVAVHYMEKLDSLLQIVYFRFGTAAALFPIFVIVLVQSSKEEIKSYFNWKTSGQILLCCLGGTAWVGSFVAAFNFTSIAHTYLFSNLHSLLIVGLRLILRKPLQKAEIMGTIIATVGGILTAFDGKTGGPNPPLGDAIAFIGSVCGVAYLLIGEQLLNKMPVSTFAFPVHFGAAIILMFIAWIFGEGDPSSMSPENGIWGWISPTWLPITAYLGIVCGVFGYVGYIAALRYLSPLIVSISMLSEPIIGMLLGILMKVETYPRWMTICGGMIVLLGTLMVCLAGYHRAQQEREEKEREAEEPVKAAEKVYEIYHQPSHLHSDLQGEFA